MPTETDTTFGAVEPPRPAAELLRGYLLANRYEIEAFLGAGGMARVYRAHDRMTRQVVALKVLDPDRSASPHYQNRLAREVRNARVINHPNVCRVHDFSAGDGRCFLTMEFADRGTLRDTLRDGVAGRGLADRLADARAIVGAVAAIHGAGIVHRDLKPENILRAGDGRLLVADFGLAFDLNSTTTVDPAGTPQYMAPELLRGSPPDQRSDVYALGVVLHELFFGCRPGWTEGSTPELRSPSVLSGAVDRAAFAVCAACLSDGSSRRPRDGAAVGALLERRLRDTVIRSRPGLPLLMVVALLALRPGERRSPGPDGPATLGIVGTPVDISRSSRPFLTFAPEVVRCVSSKTSDTLELILGEHRGVGVRALEYDLRTGRTGPSSLSPQTYAVRCPKRSPDGRRILFEKPVNDTTEILLSDDEGRSARPVAVGDEPVWTPAGDGLVFSSRGTTLGLLKFGEAEKFFEGSGPGERGLRVLAFNDRGDRLIADFAPSSASSTLVTYGYPSMERLNVSRVDRVVFALRFDQQRGNFQAVAAEGPGLQLFELGGGTLNRRVSMAGFSVADGVRTSQGLVVNALRINYSMAIVDARGREHDVFYSPNSDPVLAPSGDAVYSTLLPDGRRVISLQRWTDQRPTHLTEGPDDQSPSLGPDGQSVFFVRKDQKAIVRCHLEGTALSRCQELWRDPLEIEAAIVSPDGRMIAYYVSSDDGDLLRVLDLDSKRSRDLGNRRLTSTNFFGWATSTTTWNCDRSSGRWQEVNVVNGKSRDLPGPTISGEGAAHGRCEGRAPSLGQWPDGFRGRVIKDLVTELRLVRDL